MEENKLIYGSVCSGIEAATVAFEPLGWHPAWFSEIDSFPSKVLQHHYPNIPNLGDMRKLSEHEHYRNTSIDVLVGGTPCQSFSTAGLRGGLVDERGNLSLEYCRILIAKRPKWFIWENVPGVFSSNGGKDIACILSAFTGKEIRPEGIGNAGIIQGEFYSVAWRILDSQHFGVPQRRRRLFIVGHFGNDWRPPAGVLFERESLCRDFTPCRKEREILAQSVRGSAKDGNKWPAQRTHTLDRSFGSKQGCDNQHINSGGSWFVPYAPRLLSIMPMNSGKDYKGRFVDVTQPLLSTVTGGNQGGDFVIHPDNSYNVRRLTPLEFERLQGFPDNYTAIEGASNAARYNACGNSMTTNVMHWIGNRIDKVDRILKRL